MLVASSTHAGPAWEYEGGAQAARLVRDESEPPVGFPVSGFAAFGIVVWQGHPARAVVKIGYDDAMSRNTTGGTVPAFGGPYPDRTWLRTQSLWVPAHIVLENPAHLQLEFGPEWRYLLRAQGGAYRQDGSIPAVSGNAIAGLDRSAFAFSAGLGHEWRALNGRARLALRWVEGIGSVASPAGVTLRPHAVQLAFGWRR